MFEIRNLKITQSTFDSAVVGTKGFVKTFCNETCETQLLISEDILHSVHNFGKYLLFSPVINYVSSANIINLDLLDGE